MRNSNLLRRLQQLPVILAWKFAILFARKTYRLNIVICDVTSAESKCRDRLAADVKSILDDLALTSSELLQRIQQNVRYIARAEISNRFDYLAHPKFLLLHVGYPHQRGDLRTSIKRDIIEGCNFSRSAIPARILNRPPAGRTF
jgi:hypothetical protein